MTHRLPTAVKELKGTINVTRELKNQPRATGIAPVSTPEWIAGSQRAEEIYYQLIAHTHGMRVLSQEDDFALAMLASVLEEVEICSQFLEDEGRTYITTNKMGDKLIRSHPMVAQRSDAMRRAVALLNEFGLTPAARAKVQVKGDTAGNPFEALDG